MGEIIMKKRNSKRTHVIKNTYVIKNIGALFCLILLCFLPFISSKAEQAQGAENMQETELSQIMVADEVTPMKAEPDYGSETIMTYDKDALVFVIGETTDGWYHVTYQDKKGYVQKKALRLQEIDVEGLDAEMAANEEEGKMVVEAVEQYRIASRRSKIWGSIIIVLVVGIFAIGIFSAVKPSKGDDNSSNNGNNKKKKQIKIEDWN
ncbi:MAG: SH3 domain-containing protein [Roseburia sp.]|nr:SH3 domain-containing protein [Roseburia sp.]MCM1243769.1 SH3 domain-containing protein [Roseburia sp.]